MALCRGRQGGSPPARADLLRLALLASIVGLAAAASVRGATHPAGFDETSLEERMLHDAADGCLDGFSPLEAALIAGGVNEEAELATLVRSLRSPIDASNRGDASSWSKARALHQWMHATILTGAYNDDAADVRATLEGGEFNCLTATILYNEFCRRQGVEARAISVPGHVFSRVLGDVDADIEAGDAETSDVFDVQTTCPDWFERSPLTESARQRGRGLDEIQLIAKLYYNRGVRQHRLGQFAGAVASLRTAASLDAQDAAARENLSAAINNWALAECEAGRYRRAAELLSEGARADARFAPFVENDVYVAGRWAESLCGQRDFAQALQVLEAAQSRHPDIVVLDRALKSVRAAQERFRRPRKSAFGDR